MRKLIFRKYASLFVYVFALVFSDNGWAMKTKKPDSIYPRIDCHIHLYDTRRAGSSTFLDSVKDRKIYYPHLAKQFVETAGGAGVGYAVVIEASQRREDNIWLMNLVDPSNVLLAFIGNLDPRDPWYLHDLDLLSKSKKFRGIRIRPVTPINLADPKIIERFSELEKRHLVLELGVNGLDPEIVVTIARRYPKMNIIINHLAGAKIFDDQLMLENWKARLAVLASEPNVYCKVSAIFDLSGKNPAPLNPDFYKALIDPVVDAFGSKRVLFGSNWTLSDLFGTYNDMVRVLDDYCDRRHDLSKAQFYFENAKKAYRLK